MTRPRTRRGSHSAATRLVSALAAGLVLTVFSHRADAYCRTSVCGGGVPGQRCTPAGPMDCGTPLYWPTACLGFSVQRDGSRQIDPATAEQLMDQAFAAWESADCGGGDGPSISVQSLGPVECASLEYNQQADIGNANAILFRDDAWPYVGQGHTLALTTVTYALGTGEIYDVDLEVNATPSVQLTTGDTGVVYDLASILTHEAGHMLGLAHSADPEATMKVEYVPGDVALRTLAPDDVDAICEAFAPTRSATCDPTPRHGFRSECGAGQSDDEEGCHMGRGRGAPGRSLALLALASLGVLRRGRRQSTASRARDPRRR